VGTPLEKHAHEHEVFILRGGAILRGKDKKSRLRLATPSLSLPLRSTNLKTQAKNHFNFCAQKKHLRTKVDVGFWSEN
jgi:hypothetical protein